MKERWLPDCTVQGQSGGTSMSELRKDPVISRWVIIATERSKRPGDLGTLKDAPRAGFCPLCPGNEDKTPPEVFAVRESGPPDAAGWKVRVVPNKFPVLIIEGDLNPRTEGLYEKMDGVGAHEIIIETPVHGTTPSTLNPDDLAAVLLSYKRRIEDLRNDPRFRYVSIFKNQGERAGASLDHPSSQLIALPVVPKRTLEELAGAAQYHAGTGRCVFCDAIAQDLADGKRVVLENDAFIAVEPFASRFPFETCLYPKVHRAAFEHTPDSQFRAMADILSRVLTKINRAMQFPPYNYILHSAPFDTAAEASYHWHLEIIPRVIRMTGYEWGTGFYINPTPPEQAAQYLRDIPA
jgi:UDPglucose--hexose-1-phosphate uridylyltransferase